MDGDSFQNEVMKVRVSDIDAPETLLDARAADLGRPTADEATRAIERETVARLYRVVAFVREVIGLAAGQAFGPMIKSISA